MNAIQNEFEALGMKVVIREKKRTNKTPIESAFLKSETIWRELVLEGIIPQSGLNQPASVQIKIEVDTKPPLGFETEEKLLLRPFSFYVKTFALPFLFAGKLHPLLFRKWGINVKGRDWWDLEWYIKQGIPVDFKHFLIRSQDSGDLPPTEISVEEFIKILAKRIDTVDMEVAKDDIRRFIKDPERLEIWTPQYFHDLVTHLKINK